MRSSQKSYKVRMTLVPSATVPVAQPAPGAVPTTEKARAATGDKVGFRVGV